eukprot:TRINITY_DN88392_c0_g1_i1.p1 TRINITY_DN88392_c0_g1~~TRINITY_DN88392_c0_g1_i1.p1  ORF type:complete len:490 (-),score=62.83 TRINITY_DN88392_c0_g1_i1:357-1748(-)
MAATPMSQPQRSLASEARRQVRVPHRDKRVCEPGADHDKPRRHTVTATSAELQARELPVLLRSGAKSGHNKLGKDSSSSLSLSPRTLAQYNQRLLRSRPDRAALAESADVKRAAPQAPEMLRIDLVTNSVVGCESEGDQRDHEARLSEPSAVASAECCAASPTSEQLTESALRRSNELLNQLVQMDLDQQLGSGGDASVKSADSESRATEFLCSSHAWLDSDDDAVRVPKIVMEMLMEMWEELRAQKPSGHESESSRVKKSNLPSKMDNCLASSASTYSPKSEISSEVGSTLTGLSSPRTIPRSPLHSSRSIASPGGASTVTGLSSPRKMPCSPLPLFRSTASPLGGSTVTGLSSPRKTPCSPLPLSRSTASPVGGSTVTGLSSPRTMPCSPLPCSRTMDAPMVIPRFLSNSCTMASPRSSGNMVHMHPLNLVPTALGPQPASAVRPVAVSQTVTVTTSWVVF